ncbi:MAG: thioredoxin family protein [Culturomica sp.]|jgi:hypothetical protein|nr:thioredoxin family protein [Culturomica sp.]
MMFRILSLLLLLPLFCTGKDYEVKIHVKNLPEGSKPKLLQVFNGDFFIIDSLPAITGEELLFRVPETLPPGNIQALLGISPYARNSQPTAIELFFNREDIEVELDFTNPLATLNVIRSKENQLFYDYIRQDTRIVQKLGLLEQFIGQYPDRDDLYQTVSSYFQAFQKNRNSLIDSIYQANKEMLAARIIQTLKMPFSGGDVSPAQRDSLFKGHFFDAIRFTDTTLLYTSAYTNKLYQYLSYFAMQQRSPRESEAELMKHLDDLIGRISENDRIRNQLLNFIITGLEAWKYEEALNYISKNYLEQCEGPLELTKRRLEEAQNMLIGGEIPDFFSIDTANVAYNLYADLSPYVLIIFWQTGCPHCWKLIVEELPALVKEGLLDAHGVKLVTVSIDQDREEWKKLSRISPMPWTNTYIPGGFESETAANFNLYATPMMFLVDAEHKIVSKPQILEDILEDLKKLE